MGIAYRRPACVPCGEEGVNMLTKKQIERHAKWVLSHLAPHERSDSRVMVIQGNDGFTIATCQDKITAEIITQALNKIRAIARATGKE